MKALDEFYRLKTRHNSWCKRCRCEDESRRRKEQSPLAAKRSRRLDKLWRENHLPERRSYMKIYRKNNLEYMRLKSRAKTAVLRAIAAGHLVREPCDICGLTPLVVNGKNRIEAHHHRGYERANYLEVRWLCVPHHCQAEGEDGDALL